jgi:hypothetical protein
MRSHPLTLVVIPCGVQYNYSINRGKWSSAQQSLAIAYLEELLVGRASSWSLFSTLNEYVLEYTTYPLLQYYLLVLQTTVHISLVFFIENCFSYCAIRLFVLWWCAFPHEGGGQQYFWHNTALLAASLLAYLRYDSVINPAYEAWQRLIIIL